MRIKYTHKSKGEYKVPADVYHEDSDRSHYSGSDHRSECISNSSRLVARRPSKREKAITATNTLSAINGRTTFATVAIFAPVRAWV
jgi:hypothetical protein